MSRLTGPAFVEYQLEGLECFESGINKVQFATGEGYQTAWLNITPEQYLQIKEVLVGKAAGETDSRGTAQDPVEGMGQ